MKIHIMKKALFAFFILVAISCTKMEAPITPTGSEQEFMGYKDWKFIKSVDTSNPILVGAEGKRYTDSGLNWKPKEKLEYYFEKDLSEQKEDIIFNVQKFKQFIK